MSHTCLRLHVPTHTESCSGKWSSMVLKPYPDAISVNIWACVDMSILPDAVSGVLLDRLAGAGQERLQNNKDL